MRVLSREQVSGPAPCPAPGLLGFGMADVSAPLRSMQKRTRLQIGRLVLVRCSSAGDGEHSSFALSKQERRERQPSLPRLFRPEVSRAADGRATQLKSAVAGG
jgi:hypothetical protein